jgi:hypothetical protein
MQIGQPLDVRLTLSLMALLKLSGKLLLDGVRTGPCLKPFPISLVLDLQVRQGSQRALKLSQKSVRIAGSLCHRHRRS